MSESYVSGGHNRVVVTGVDIPFVDLMILILKVMLASIPAYIILFIIFSMLMGIFGGALVGLMGAGMR